MATPTYTLITSVTVGSGGASNFDLTSIPSTYTDLLVKLSARTTSNYGNTFAQTDIALNATGSSSSTNDKALFGYNGSASTNILGTGSTYGVDSSSATASTFGNTNIYIPNYTNSAQKVIYADGVAETNSTTAAIVALNTALYDVYSAVNRVTITPTSGAGNFAQYSTIYLYGIKNS